MSARQELQLQSLYSSKYMTKRHTRRVNIYIQNYILETVGCLGPWGDGLGHSSCKTGKVEMS